MPNRITILSSLLFHTALGLWFWKLAPQKVVTPQQVIEPIVISLVTETPEPVPQSIPKPVPEKAIEPKKAPIKPTVVKPVLPQPTIKKTVVKQTTKPVKKRPSKKQNIRPIKTITKPKVVIAKQAPSIQTAQNTAAKAQKAKATYEQILSNHINKHKRYPRRAKNLRMQGTGQVKFHLSPNGDLLSRTLTKSTGHHILDKEITATLIRAEPFPRPPKDIDLNFQVPLRFLLR